jgi:hypothetical protein
MKKIFIFVISSLFTLTSMTLSAEPIKSAQEVEGIWHLDYTKKTPDDTNQKDMDVTWILKNGKLQQKGIEQQRGDNYDSPEVDYVIEEGLLKVSLLGRAGKYDTYALETKTDKEMVLKDTKYGNYLYFTRK